uniref:Uncharacterized protein n=1 Tax=Populus trichocarpa TaxID=3694 RepID=A0A2K2ASH8_POPTR
MIFLQEISRLGSNLILYMYILSHNKNYIQMRIIYHIIGSRKNNSMHRTKNCQRIFLPPFPYILHKLYYPKH